MSAQDNISSAAYALQTVNSLIVAEAMLDGEGDSDGDIANLRTAQAALTSYIADTSAEVGSDADIEQVEEDAMNDIIRRGAGYSW